MQHFERNDLFHGNHHGFLPNRCTLRALLQIYDAENKYISGTMFLDLSATFGIVPQNILLDKLSLYGFSDNTASFFKSFILGRKQIVQVQAKLSEH